MKGSFRCLLVCLVTVLLLTTAGSISGFAQWPGGSPNTRPSGHTGTQQSSNPTPVVGTNSVSVHVIAAGGVDLPNLVHVELQLDGRGGSFTPGSWNGVSDANLATDAYKDGYCDHKGFYSFTALPDGSYRITVSAPGFLPRNADVLLNHSAREEVTVEVSAAPDTVGYELDGGTVSVAWLAVPEKARNKFLKAQERFAKRDFNGAIKLLNEALANDSNFVYAYNQLGLAYWDLQKFPEAKEAFERAIAIDPKFMQAPMNLADMYVSQQQYAEAVPILSQVSEKHPERGEPYYEMGRLFLALGNVDRAETACQEALKRDVSKTPEVHIVLSNVYIRKQELGKVTEQLQAYLTAAPQGRYAKSARENLDKIKQEQAKNGGAAPANGAAAASAAGTAGDAPPPGDNPRQ
jgi:tetratricopeptide (TPR) repeat protein